MYIAIGSDHRGFALKKNIMHHFADSESENSISWIDVGCFDADSCDYPSYAVLVAQALQSGRAARGILICGSGVGMSIVANRFAGIYAALAWNEEVAQQSHANDKSNILVLPSNFVTSDQAVAMINIWLNTVFLGGHYQDRIAMIDALPALCKK